MCHKSSCGGHGQGSWHDDNESITRRGENRAVHVGVGDCVQRCGGELGSGRVV